MASRRDKVIGGLILLALVGLALNGGLNLAPSYEGPHVTFYGFQPAGSTTVYTFNDPNPVNGQNNAPWVDSIGIPATFGPENSYSWSGSGTTLDVKHTAPDPIVGPLKMDKVGVTASTSIQPDYNPATGTPIVQGIDYFVPDPYNANNTVEVQGYMVQYKVQVVLNVDSDSGNAIHYQGAQFWVEMFAETWNNYQLTASTSVANGTQIGAWSAPVLLVFTGGHISPSDATSTTTPQWQNTGQQILNTYSLPQVSAALGTVATSGVNQTLATGSNPYAPDTRMSQVSFFPITMNDVGGIATFLGLGNNEYPAITLNFELYELQLGRYLWTNPTTQAINGTGQCGSGSHLRANGTCSNPFTDVLDWIGANPLTFLLIVAVVIFVLIAVFAPEVFLLVPSRKKSGTKA